MQPSALSEARCNAFQLCLTFLLRTLISTVFFFCDTRVAQGTLVHQMDVHALIRFKVANVSLSKDTLTILTQGFIGPPGSLSSGAEQGDRRAPVVSK